MEYKGTTNFVDFLFSWTGLIFLILVASTIFFIIRMFQLFRNRKEEEEESENRTNVSANQLSKEENYPSPTPLTTQTILRDKYGDEISNEELYQKDCAIGELNAKDELEEFETMKDDEIVIDVPINENQIKNESKKENE